MCQLSMYEVAFFAISGKSSHRWRCVYLDSMYYECSQIHGNIHKKFICILLQVEVYYTGLERLIYRHVKIECNSMLPTWKQYCQFKCVNLTSEKWHYFQNGIAGHGYFLTCWIYTWYQKIESELHTWRDIVQLCCPSNKISLHQAFLYVSFEWVGTCS